MIRTLPMLVALLLVPVPQQPAKDPVAADIEALQGSWKVVAIKIKGIDFGGRLPEHKYSFVKDQFFMGDSNGLTYKIDPTKNPKHLNIGNGDDWLAIYQLENDTLHICWGPNGERVRPTDFTMKNDAGFRHLILKRSK